MSDATLIQTADALAAELLAAVSAGEFGADITPTTSTTERSYATWEDVVKVRDGLRLDVVPFKYDESGLMSRTRIGYACSVDVYVRKKFDGTQRDANSHNQIKRAEIDRLVRFTQDINERFIARRLPTMTSATWRSGTILNAYSRKHLREHSMFFAAVRFVFDTPEAVLVIA